MFVNPDAVCASWAAGGSQAAAELAGIDLERMEGRDLADLAAGVAWAAGEFAGIVDVGGRILGETRERVEACLADYALTDQRSAGTFTGVTAP
nr:hypothetical protein [Propionicimonas sp.]